MRSRQVVGFPADTVVVVPARWAWGEYQACHAYVCQYSRRFRETKYLAFYSDQEIKPTIPLIENNPENVVWDPTRHTGRLAKTIECLNCYPGFLGRHDLTSYKVFLLSEPQHSETLANPVNNNLGKVFHMQRYVTLENLRNAHHTSDLVFLIRNEAWPSW